MPPLAHWCSTDRCQRCCDEEEIEEMRPPDPGWEPGPTNVGKSLVEVGETGGTSCLEWPMTRSAVMIYYISLQKAAQVCLLELSSEASR